MKRVFYTIMLFLSVLAIASCGPGRDKEDSTGSGSPQGGTEGGNKGGDSGPGTNGDSGLQGRIELTSPVLIEVDKVIGVYEGKIDTNVGLWSTFWNFGRRGKSNAVLQINHSGNNEDPQVIVHVKLTENHPDEHLCSLHKNLKLEEGGTIESEVESIGKVGGDSGAETGVKLVSIVDNKVTLMAVEDNENLKLKKMDEQQVQSFKQLYDECGFNSDDDEQNEDESEQSAE